MTTIRKIAIQQPCNQSWQQMDETGTGRHCRHCTKTVVDFSKMNNAEILSYLGTGQQVCGRFGMHQITAINHQLSMENLAVVTDWKKWLVAAGLLGTGLLNRAVAQSVPPKIAVTQNNTDTTLKKKILLGDVGVAIAPIARKVSGRIVDADDNLPLTGVQVRIKGTHIGVVTDTDGHFNISLSQNYGVLVFSYIGFRSQEIVPGESGNNIIQVAMHGYGYELGGPIIMPVRYPFYKRWYNRFVRRPIHKLFN